MDLVKTSYFDPTLCRLTTHSSLKQANNMRTLCEGYANRPALFGIFSYLLTGFLGGLLAEKQSGKLADF
jgi:hypothetical protein